MHENSPRDDAPFSCRQVAAALAVFLGVALVIMDGTIANVGLPIMAHSLGVSDASSIWIINAYLMVLLAFLFPAIRLAGRVGHRTLFLTGILIFTLASLGCCLAGSFRPLVLFRALQGLGGAAILSVNIALVERIFPPRLLGRGIGLNTATISLSIIMGPALAGLILTHATWPWLFAINLPTGLLALGTGLLFLPADRTAERGDTPAPLPSVRQILLNLLLFAAFFALTGVVAYGFPIWTGAVSAAALVAGGLLLARAERTGPARLFPTELLGLPGFGITVACLLFCFMAQSGTVLALPFLLMDRLSFDIADTSLLLICWPALHILASLGSGFLTERLSPHRLCCAGMLLCAAGIISIFLVEPPVSLAGMGLRIALCGLGFGLFQAPNDTISLLSTPTRLRAQTSAMLAFARTLGQTLGAMVTASAFLWFAGNFFLPFLLAASLALAGLAAVALRAFLGQAAPGREIR